MVPSATPYTTSSSPPILLEEAVQRQFSSVAMVATDVGAIPPPPSAVSPPLVRVPSELLALLLPGLGPAVGLRARWHVRPVDVGRSRRSLDHRPVARTSGHLDSVHPLQPARRAGVKSSQVKFIEYTLAAKS